MLKSQQQQRGVTLIESMVALLVVSIGLLGIAALQITAVKQNNSALHHSQAVLIAYNITDRIRANIPQFNNYAGISTSNSYTQDCTAAACIPSQMVTADAVDWSTLMQKLPGGKGTITGDAIPPNQLLIKVMWDDEGTGVTGENCLGAVSDLTCYTVTLIK